MSPAELRVVIVGAGVGGLTLALLLRRRGITAEVVEQAPELREAGAAIALAANATRVLEHLGLGDDLAAASTEPTAVIHRDGRDGHPVTAHPMGGWYRAAFGAPFYGLHRAGLQQLLAGAWGPGHLHLGCRVDTLEERGQAVRVRCASGAVFDADVVVGADGVHSRVRSWVTGGDLEPVYSHTSGFRGLVPAVRLPSLPDPGALQFWDGARRAPAALPDRWRTPDQLPGSHRGPGAVDRAGLDGDRCARRPPLRPSPAGIRPSPKCSQLCPSRRAGDCSPSPR